MTMNSISLRGRPSARIRFLSLILAGEVRSHHRVKARFSPVPMQAELALLQLGPVTWRPEYIVRLTS